MKAAMKIPSNTPLNSPPEDYCPAGSAYWFELEKGFDKGKKLFYSDYTIGEGKPEATVVFVHGNPESSYTYRHIRDALIHSGQSMRIIAMDHIGFGLSDQATFEMVEMHHANNLLQLIQHLDLNQVTLAVHDWGGPIGMGAFIQEPGRVRNIVVMNSTVFPMPSDGFTYENYPVSWLPWCQTPKIMPDKLWAGVAAYVVSHSGPQSSFKFILNTSKYTFRHAFGLLKQGTPEHVWAQSLSTKANARSSKRMVRQTPVWGHGYTYMDPTHGRQDNHSFYEFMQNNIAASWGGKNSQVNVAGFFGQWDACGKDSIIKQWQSALPKMKDDTHTFSDVGHFVEEQKGPEIAEAILKMHEHAERENSVSDIRA